MTCPFLGDGSGVQIPLFKNNLSFNKYVYRNTPYVYINKYIDNTFITLYLQNYYISYNYNNLSCKT